MQRLTIVAVALTTALSAQKDIVSTAVEAGKFTTLVKAVQAAKLVETLQGDGPFTVFAPTDAAFGKIDRHVLADLLKRKNRSKLQGILTFHVVPGALMAKDVLSRTTLDTVNGQRLAVTMDGDTAMVGGAGIVATDIRCSNGVIHVVDSIMMPTTDTIPAVARSAGAFGTLLAAAKAAGLVDTLSGEGPLTVLAPTDDAFGKLPAGTVENLLKPANKSQLVNILTYHVIPGRVFANQAVSVGSADTVQGEKVRFSIDGGRLQVQNANIVGTDVQAGNGVIHVIDRVLIPQKKARPAGRLIIGVHIERPSKALSSQLGIDRNQSLLVTSVTRRGNAEAAGIERYDVLTLINGMPATEKNLDKAKEAVGFEGVVELELLRKGQSKKIKVPVGVDKH